MTSKEIINNLDKIDITEPVPANEPERQYYFIKKAKEIYKLKREEAGRDLPVP